MLSRCINLPENLSFFLLGPRQTGKTTLISSRLPPNSMVVDLLKRDRFIALSKNPSLLREEVEMWLSGRAEGNLICFRRNCSPPLNV